MVPKCLYAVVLVAVAGGACSSGSGDPETSSGTLEEVLPEVGSDGGDGYPIDLVVDAPSPVEEDAPSPVDGSPNDLWSPSETTDAPSADVSSPDVSADVAPDGCEELPFTGMLAVVETEGTATLTMLESTETGYVAAFAVSGANVDWNGAGVAELACGPDSDCDDAVVVWLDENLELERGQRIGGDGPDRVTGAAMATDGSLTLVGQTASTNLVHGAQTLATTGQSDGVVLRFDALGSPQWALVIGGELDDGVNAVGSDGDQGVFLGGWTQSPTLALGNELFESQDDNCMLLDCGDLLLARVNAAGEVLWARSHGGNQGERFALVKRAGDSLVAAGSFGSWQLPFGPFELQMQETICGPMFGCSDLLAVTFALDGQPTWAAGYGGDLLDTLLGGHVSDAGDLVLVGEFSSSSLDFGLGPLVNSGDHEAFVAAVDPAVGPHFAVGIDAFLRRVTSRADGVLVAGVRTSYQTAFGGCAPATGTVSIVLGELAPETGELMADAVLGTGEPTTDVTGLASRADAVVVGGAFQGTFEGLGTEVESKGATAAFLLRATLPLTP